MRRSWITGPPPPDLPAHLDLRASGSRPAASHVSHVSRCQTQRRAVTQVCFETIGEHLCQPPFNGRFRGDLWRRVTTSLHFQIPELPQWPHQLICLLKHLLLSWTGMKIYSRTQATRRPAEAAARLAVIPLEPGYPRRRSRLRRVSMAVTYACWFWCR